jgi:hypothetical protein
MWADESIVKYELKLPVENPQVTRSFIAFLVRLCDEAEEKERREELEREENRKNRTSLRRRKPQVSIKSEPEEIPDADSEPEPPTTPESEMEDKVKCECGTIVKKSGLTRHKKCDKHKNYIAKL